VKQKNGPSLRERRPSGLAWGKRVRVYMTAPESAQKHPAASPVRRALHMQQHMQVGRMKEGGTRRVAPPRADDVGMNGP